MHFLRSLRKALSEFETWQQNWRTAKEAGITKKEQSVIARRKTRLAREGMAIMAITELGVLI
jgi:hypothetical protein